MEKSPNLLEEKKRGRKSKASPFYTYVSQVEGKGALSVSKRRTRKGAVFGQKGGIYTLAKKRGVRIGARGLGPQPSLTEGGASWLREVQNGEGIC